MSLSERELAERSGVTPGTVRRLVELGILVRRDADGPFQLDDVHRVRLMEAFEAAGVDLRAIARGIAAGEVSYENLGLFLSEPAALSKTYGELADETGRSPELLRRLVHEFGLPQSPAESTLREDDARVLADLLAVWAEADDEELARLARTYGESLRRLVVSDLQLANTALFSRVRSSSFRPRRTTCRSGAWCPGGRAVPPRSPSWTSPGTRRSRRSGATRPPRSWPAAWRPSSTRQPSRTADIRSSGSATA